MGEAIRKSNAQAVGFIGLGRMGSRMAERLLEKGFGVVAYNRSPGPLKEAGGKGAVAVSGCADVAKRLSAPRIIWLMVPAGRPVDDVIEELLPALAKGDIVIDGGNSNYKDSVRRAGKLEEKGIFYLDVGTSGGLEGAGKGACLTIGGEKEAYEKAGPVFKAVSAKEGYLYVGPSGAGHFVKMVHNAIEYGMLESYGEGFEMLKKSDYKLDLAAIARTWENGSVVRSWMLELCRRKLEEDAGMEGVSGEIGGGETGRWAVEYAEGKNIEIPVIKTSLGMRGVKEHAGRYAGKIVGAIRNAFGGHEMKRK